MSDAVVGLLLILAGGFSALGAVMDWDWFMNHRRARMFVRLFGRQGARVFYVILGIVLALFGVVAIATS